MSKAHMQTPPEALPCFSCKARHSPLCSVFDDEHIGILFARARIRTLKAGAYLLHEEDRARQIYNTSSGALALERLASDGARQIMAFCYAGDFIGISSGPSWTVSARALKPSTACQWQEADIHALYRDWPKLEERIHAITSRVVEAIMDQLFVLGRKKAPAKIAWFLLFTEARLQNVRGTGGVFTMPMTRIDIADYLGLTVETVSRAFSDLRRKGYIRITDKWQVEIRDRAALAALSGYIQPGNSRRKG